MATSISDRVYNLCRSTSTVSSELAANPSLVPGEVASRLYGSERISVVEKKPPTKRRHATQEDLERAYQCGKFGDMRPSELFLRIFHDALCTLEHDPLIGCVSPPLMGSTGVLPLSIIGTLPDICRHMSNLIARAEKEVFLATNFWIASDASRLITDSLRELSRRAGERGERAVVKVLYDRGNPKQIFENHQSVSAAGYTGKNVQIPPPEEISNIDLQVINYHRPILGTFHTKLMVVDRRVAVISSNNIQDNDNLEMMTHLQGPIVDSLYDVCLISWHNALKPPLPMLDSPAAEHEIPVLHQQSFQNPLHVQNKFEPSKSSSTNGISQDIADGKGLLGHVTGNSHYENNIAAEVERAQRDLLPQGGESKMEAVTRYLNEALRQTRKGTAPDCAPEEDMIPYIPHAVDKPFPIVLANRKPWGAPNHACVYTPQNEAWLSAIRNAQSSVFIQTPNLNAEPLLPEMLAAVRRGIEMVCYVCLGYNDAGELLPSQGGTNEMVANKLYLSLEPEERKLLHVYYYVAKDQTQPIHNKFKSRSCHIKLMIVDQHIGIQGNGNQDTQSWYHSQEVNIMIDSATVCEQWLDGIRRNQNTHVYGKASQEDGIWRDAEGREAKGAIGKDPGRFAWAKGVIGAVQRVRGAGGF